MNDRYIVDGASVRCSYGSATGVFRAGAGRQVFIHSKAQGSIRDCEPGIHIPAFGMCSSKHNPDVIAASQGQLDRLVPQPCRPSVSMAWLNGKNNVMVDHSPALLSCSTNMCMWCGEISFDTDGQE